jgi:hypothetical protein
MAEAAAASLLTLEVERNDDVAIVKCQASVFCTSSPMV